MSTRTNCKPGDLAKIIYPGVNRDKLVFVIRKMSPDEVKAYGFIWSGGVSWLVEAAGAELKGNKTWRTYKQRPMADTSLRPLRDPGEDAVDEVIQRLGSPNKQEQKA